jgi:hypothetical protein
VDEIRVPLVTNLKKCVKFTFGSPNVYRSAATMTRNMNKTGTLQLLSFVGLQKSRTTDYWSL